MDVGEPDSDGGWQYGVGAPQRLSLPSHRNELDRSGSGERLANGYRRHHVPRKLLAEGRLYQLIWPPSQYLTIISPDLQLQRNPEEFLEID